MTYSYTQISQYLIRYSEHEPGCASYDETFH